MVDQGEIEATYRETDTERQLIFTNGDRSAVLAQNLDGYAMVAVRRSPGSPELERYYGLDMALDHAAELLGSTPAELPLPDEASDMGM